MRNLSLVVLGAMLFTACGGGNGSKLDGTWKIADVSAFAQGEGGAANPMVTAMAEGMRFNFNKDTAVFDLSMVAITYTYKKAGDTLVMKSVKASMMGMEMPAGQSEDLGKTEKFAYRFDGDKLILTPAGATELKNEMVLVRTTAADDKQKAKGNTSPGGATPAGAAEEAAKALEEGLDTSGEVETSEDEN
jgi:hypothetical protein